MRRVRRTAGRGPKQGVYEAHEVLKPERLEPQFGVQPRQFGRDEVLDEVIAGDDGDRRVALRLVGAELTEKVETIEKWHSQVEEDRIGMRPSRLVQARFGVQSREHVVPLQSQHPSERVGHDYVVVHDQNRTRFWMAVHARLNARAMPAQVCAAVTRNARTGCATSEHYRLQSCRFAPARTGPIAGFLEALERRGKGIQARAGVSRRAGRAPLARLPVPPRPEHC